MNGICIATERLSDKSFEQIHHVELFPRVVIVSYLSPCGYIGI